MPMWSFTAPRIRLFAAQVALSCLDGDVSKKELNLFQLSTTCMAELGARAPEIVGSKLCNAEFFCILLNDVPDHPFGYAVAPIFARATHTSEQPPL